MNNHKENLLKIIKMINVVERKGNINEINLRTVSLYFSTDSIISLRELTRMLIEELNSEYMECRKGDEIVEFIENILEKLQHTYDKIVEKEFSHPDDIKLMKICGQLIKDYQKIYDEAKIKLVTLGEDKPLTDAFAFGKKHSPINKSITNNSNIQPIVINMSINGDNIDTEKLSNELIEIAKRQINNR